MCCPTHCDSNCAPCQPLLRASSVWIFISYTFPFCTSSPARPKAGGHISVSLVRGEQSPPLVNPSRGTPVVMAVFLYWRTIGPVKDTSSAEVHAWRQAVSSIANVYDVVCEFAPQLACLEKRPFRVYNWHYQLDPSYAPETRRSRPRQPRQRGAVAPPCKPLNPKP